jgi:hypothetical protein
MCFIFFPSCVVLGCSATCMLACNILCRMLMKIHIEHLDQCYVSFVICNVHALWFKNQLTAEFIISVYAYKLDALSSITLRQIL